MISIERLLQTFLQHYAMSEAKAVAPFIVGSRALDLGAGEGYVGAALLKLYGHVGMFGGRWCVPSRAGILCDI